MAERNFLPLVDKYKPKTLDKIILPIEVHQKIKKAINRKYITNTIIVGYNGTGKTLILKLLAKGVLGDFYDDACLNLNTTNHRGLKDLETLLPSFCEKAVMNFEGKKLIIIDEADSLTKKAQNLITNIMNDHGEKVVFIFTCNDSKKIEDSILSKCSTMFIPRVKPNDIVKLLEELCIREEVFYTDEALMLISVSSNGDVRSAINLLDNVRNGFQMVDVANTKVLLYRPSNVNIENFINLCIQKDLFSAINVLSLLKQKGFCGTDILLSIFNYLSLYSKLSEKSNIQFISIIVKFYTRMSEGIDTDLQLYACVSQMIKCNLDA